MEQKQIKTWMGQDIIEYELPFKNPIVGVPEFRREPWSDEGVVNQYLDKVVRLPFRDDHRTIPVSTVSKSYALVQHREVIMWLVDGLNSSGVNTKNLKVNILMSLYGERMEAKVELPGFAFDPGDGFSVAQYVAARNSIDRSCSLEFLIIRMRLVCSNGLWIAEKEDKLRKIHNLNRINTKNIVYFIKNRIQHAHDFQDHANFLFNQSVSINEIENWADKILKEEWGVQAAARLCHIARSGYDGMVSRKPPKNSKACDYSVSSDTKVPGACAPINNLWHFTQALTWISNNKTSIEDFQKSVSKVPYFIDTLIKQEF